MFLRAAWLVAALVASPAWAQETQTFDFSRETLQKIAQNSAATQYSNFRLVEPLVIEPEPEPQVRFVPPEKPAKPKAVAKRPVRPAKPRTPGLFEQFVELLVEEAFDAVLGIEDDPLAEFDAESAMNCQPSTDPGSQLLRFEKCPGRPPTP